MKGIDDLGDQNIEEGRIWRVENTIYMFYLWENEE